MNISNLISAEWEALLKSPLRLGAKIDEDTNVFTLGALIFDFFGEFTGDEIAKRYKENQFLLCSPDKWKLNNDTYNVALKATHLDRKKRYQTISEFYSAWKGK